VRTLSNKQLAYFLLRLAFGFNFLGHGLVRLPKIDGFRAWMVGVFQNSLLPSFVLPAFATILPFVEFAIGLFLIIGLFTRYTLVAGALLMVALIFGSCRIEKWEFLGFQLIYTIFIGVLICLYEYNCYSLDSKF
jgi:thiosulfate dehydrogenase [quinone] large subunit